MEVARVAALRGHEVILYEKEPELGGQMVLAAMPPHKTPIQDFVNYLETQIKKLGVKIERGTEVTPTLVEAQKPNVVILATGVTQVFPKIPGIDRANVVTAEDVLRSKIEVGQKVVIIGGGMVGCEIADYLSEMGKEVTVIEMLPEMATGMGYGMRTRLLNRLADKGVSTMTGARCLEIRADDLVVLNCDSQTQTINADTVVLAVGSKSNRELCQTVGSLVSETYLVGDCVEPHRILEAVADGFRIGLMI